MDCIQAQNLLSEYQDGALDDGAAAGLAAHLRGCGECAGADASLLAVRELLRGLPPDPAPPELLARVLAAVEAEDRNARPGSASGGADATRPFLSRFRVPLEAAAAVLLFTSVYWYQQTSTPAPRPPSGISSEAGKASASGPMEAKEDTAKGSPPGIRLPRGNQKTAKKAVPSAPKPRAWTAENLPSVPVYLASTDSERIVPVAPPRPLSTLPYGRDIVVNVKPESREGAEERVAEATLRLGGIVERIERENDSARNGAAGTIRVILPEAAAAGFLDELRRIGNVPQESLPPAIDIPAGPQPGTVAYAVRIRVR
ncbi:MAG: zf-HC2 domain-containing protein [Desulfobacteria bacterium]